MMRMLSLMIVGWSSLAVAPVPAAPVASAPAAPAAAQTATPPEAEPEPKMKKVCRPVEVVGSSIPRVVCTMKKVRVPAVTPAR